MPAQSTPEPAQPNRTAASPTALGTRLRTRREALRLTLAQAAHDTKIAQQYLAAFEAGLETGLTDPQEHQRLLLRYARYLGFGPRRLPKPAQRRGRLAAFVICVTLVVLVCFFGFAILPRRQPLELAVAIVPVTPPVTNPTVEQTATDEPTQPPVISAQAREVLPSPVAITLPTDTPRPPPTATSAPTELISSEPSPTSIATPLLSTPLLTVTASAPLTETSATALLTPTHTSAISPTLAATVVAPATVTPTNTNTGVLLVATDTPLSIDTDSVVDAAAVLTPSVTLVLLPTATPAPAESSTPTATPTLSTTETALPTETATAGPVAARIVHGRIGAGNQHYLRVEGLDPNVELRLVATVDAGSPAFDSSLKLYAFSDLKFRDVHSTADFEQNDGASETQSGALSVLVQSPVPQPLHLVLINYAAGEVEYTLTASQGLIRDDSGLQVQAAE